MPKKKKSGHNTVAGQLGGSTVYSSGTNGGAPESHYVPEAGMSELSLHNKDEIVRSMHDMFSHLDPDVIYIVLSEASFKVEHAMDALLELSDAAEAKATTSSLSGFEMAAALLERHPSPMKSSTLRSITSGSCSFEDSEELNPETTRLTEEFDSLIDKELESLTMHQPVQSSGAPAVLPVLSESVPLSFGAPPSPFLAQEASQALDQLDVEIDSELASTLSSSYSAAKTSAQRNPSPLNELSFGGACLPQESSVAVDFSHLTHDSTSAAPRPSAFKAYHRPDQFPNQISASLPHSQSRQASWNLQAPDFKPYPDGPAFITPVVPAPNPWTTYPASITQWSPIGKAPLKPSATVPKSWMLSPQSRLKLEGQVLVLLRGAPGSGKSTLASAMLKQNPSGVILSTDDYFTQNGVYHFEPHLLGEAHAWNHQRAKEAFEKSLTPIIIDNTNLQCWEMKPYVALAQKHKYRVLFREPNTWWKAKPRELEKHTKHGVTKEKIRRMLENQDRYVTVQNIMASQPKSTAVYGVDVCRTHLTEQPLASHPDLVGDSGFGKPGSYLSSSLPDVSSVDCKCSSMPANMDAAPSGSKEFMPCQETGDTELFEAPQDKLLDGTGVDEELGVSGQNESRMNDDISQSEEMVLERPVLFAESIGQRVRRVREQVRTADRDASTLNCGFTDSGRKGSHADSVHDYAGDANSLNTEQLHFVFDWPTESLEQRGQRSRTSTSQTVKTPEEELLDFEQDTSKSVGHFNSDTPNKTEFQKLVDLLLGDSNVITRETAQDILPIGDDRHHSSLTTQLVLPDSVFDRKSERSSDPGKSDPHTSSPTKDVGASQNASSQRGAKEKCSDVHTPANGLMDLETGLEAKDKPNHNTSLSLRAGGEVECSSDNSQERRKVPSRRSGKSCKLALTFTHQNPSSCLNTGSPVTSLQQSKLSPELPLATYSSAFTQTESKDFALLWRIDQQKSSGNQSDESGGCTRGVIIILEGKPLRFVAETSKEESSEQQVIPYRVCHEKGSQLEENDLIELPRKEDNLDILGQHFKSVPKETLEDLYNKCHQDIEWTTNLLLDSGEHLSKDDDKNVFHPQDAEGYDLGLGSKEESCDGQEFLEPTINSTRDTVVEEAGSNSCENPVPNNTSLVVSIADWKPEDRNNQSFNLSEHQPDMPDQHEGASRPSLVMYPDEPVAEYKDLEDSLHPELESKVLQLELCGKSLDVGLKDEIEDDQEIDEVVKAIWLSQLEEMERKKDEQRKEGEKERSSQRKNGTMSIQTLELKLTTELALQLTELFGPVGISPGEFSPEHCSVVMDLNLAKLLHQKWKDTIQEKQRQAALSYLLQESSVHSADTHPAVAGQTDSAAHFLIGTDGYSSLGQSGVQDTIPFMDHWNVSHPPVSLRDIMLEEQVLQDSLEKSRLSRWDLDKKDGAAILKEKQLFALFPSIDRHFLRDIFRDNNYSLEQTEQFLHTLLDDGPVRTVIASGSVPGNNEKSRAPSKEKKQKNETDTAQFQDIEDPEYQDFRTEANLQRQRQQECFNKAAEAYRQGRKDVASFYAQQGQLHGQKMKEANHRAAVQIFDRVNGTLLPQNVLDLHGLHVAEALNHLQQVLALKTSEWQQGLCRPQLSVITGRGNHSQGGVARIRPAVLDYLKTQHYKYTEPKLGLVIVMLH